MTANLQTPLTIKQIAQLMNVSERSIYYAKKIHALRPDLTPEVEAGRMSINEAHRIATGRTKPTSWDRLVAAWNSASEDDRDRFILCIMRDGDQ